MFVVNILDDYDAISESYSYDTLEEALVEVKSQVLNGTLRDNVQLLQRLDLTYTLDVQVKAQ